MSPRIEGVYGHTWTCHACGKERPDSAISVVTRDTSKEHGLPTGTFKDNVRYCNDNPECAKAAREKRWSSPAPEPNA